MNLTRRNCRNEDDWARIRAFLRSAMLAGGLSESSWHVGRLDYWRWHIIANDIDGEGRSVNDMTFIWETSDGEIAAVLNPDSYGQAFLQLHPSHSSVGLQAEMVKVAEQRLAKQAPDGARTIEVWADSQDVARASLLVSLGYELAPGGHEHGFRRLLDQPIPEAETIPGYTIRPLADGLELLERCYASGLGFHKGDIRVAVDNRSDPTWYRNIQTAPLYRRDLDLVAVAADGSIASFCTIWYDDVTRTALYEPVATVPAHQGRGLAKATMLEGLRRLKRMGAVAAFVGGYSEAARALYASFAGEAPYAVAQPWVRRWPGSGSV